ncbi:MAG: hypothetical protein NTX66_04610 [Candidatus Falkowbacteria bacterium]|nr:hypothetical protein [Candidatus Falkowbacteria bacterium]
MKTKNKTDSPKKFGSAWSRFLQSFRDAPSMPEQFGSEYNRLLQIFKDTDPYSIAEKECLKDIIYLLVERPEILYTSWVDTPTYLKEHYPLVFAFHLANQMNKLADSIATQPTVAMNADTKFRKVLFDISELKGRARMVCSNFMAVPSLNREIL